MPHAPTTAITVPPPQEPGTVVIDLNVRGQRFRAVVTLYTIIDIATSLADIVSRLIG